jgi:glycine betaine/choline ABC-type transport system substrate-binding protein
VVHTQVVDRYGPGLVRLLDAVSAQLTTAELTGLNRRVVVDDQPASGVAAGWLRAHPVN